MTEQDYEIESSEDFNTELKAYHAMKNDLLELYEHEFVAIYRGAVVGVDKDKGKLIAKVRDEFGPVRVLIKKVEKDEPQVRLPSSRRLLEE